MAFPGSWGRDGQLPRGAAVADTPRMAASEAPQAPSLQLWGVPSLLPAPAAQAVAFGPERRFQLLLLLALERGQWLDRDRIAALLLSLIHI